MASTERTERQRRGDAAEALVAERLQAAGWLVLGRQVRIGRDEVDIVALDPGPPAMAVVVEVRSGHSSRFGPPEERVDEAKVRRLYRAMLALRSATTPGERIDLPTGIAWRVDLVVLDATTGQLRQLRGLVPR